MTSSPAGMLQALMAAAAHDSDARNQALALLRKATLWACAWPTDATKLRTVTTAQGATALPLFSDQARLDEAATRHGWLTVDGALPGRHLDINDAVLYARASGIGVLVVDLASAHPLELDDGDMELLAATSRTSTKPPSTRGLSAVSSAPPDSAELDATPGSSRPRRPSSHTHLRPASVLPPAPDGTVSATFGGASQAGLEALADEVEETTIDALVDVLWGYPEVEWACLVLASRGGPGESAPAVGVRVDPQFRKHLNEIIVALREAGIAHGATFDVLLLDDAETMRVARQVGTPIYPWRK